MYWRQFLLHPGATLPAYSAPCMYWRQFVYSSGCYTRRLLCTLYVLTSVRASPGCYTRRLLWTLCMYRRQFLCTPLFRHYTYLCCGVIKHSFNKAVHSHFIAVFMRFAIISVDNESVGVNIALWCRALLVLWHKRWLCVGTPVFENGK